MPIPSSCTKAFTFAALLGIAAMLASTTGCAGRSGSFVLPTPSPASRHPAFLGNVHGGQQPLSGATIQLWEAGTAGNASASLPLLGAPVLTNGSGGFYIASYSCDFNSLVYLTATGGNPGLSATTNNTAITLMAALGTCDFANSDSSGNIYYTLNLSTVDVNEVTTVAAVYALAPFMKDYTHIGSGLYQGPIAHAFQTAAMIADIGTGLTPGPALPASVTYDPSTGFPSLVNSLANAIAGCVNTDGTGQACSQLFNNTSTLNATGAPGSTPNETSGALLSIVINPASNVVNLFNLASPAPPFAPSFSTAPADWTLALHYTRLGLNNPSGVAFDSSGNLWIANPGASFITEVYSGSSPYLHPIGTFTQFSGGGILGPQALAVDPSDQIWIANTGGSSIVELDNSGNILSGTGYTGGGINAPVSIAMDNNGSAWVANLNGNSLTQLLSDGTPSSFSPISIPAFGYPVLLPTAVAVAGDNSVWVSNSGLGSNGLLSMTLHFNGSGNEINCTPAAPTLAGPLGLAVDGSNHVWIAGNGVDTVQGYNSACGAVGNNGPATGGGIHQPAAIAIDGSNNIWAINSLAAGSISEIAAANSGILSPAAGFGSLNTPTAIAIDASGNLWTANSGDNSLTEFIGIAAPTIAPIVNGLP